MTLSLGNGKTQPFVEASGRLPSDPDLYQLYATWATAYRQLGLQGRSESDPSIERSIIDVETCRNTARLLSDRLNRWLQAESFRPIRTALMAELEPSDDIQMLIQTSNVWLRRLPWHVWELSQAFPTLEIGLMTQAIAPIPVPLQSRAKVRVLSVLSSANGVDPSEEQYLLSQLPNSDVSLLLEPNLETFYQALTANSWDIIFISGQLPGRIAGETGRFYLNTVDSLSLDELYPIVEVATNGGLQLLVVNSWDGMAIAPAFETIGIPQLVTMREPAPTAAAYHFFKAFLSEFSNGKSFYRSSRKARQALDRLDAEFPCISWLPIISQHPAIHPPKWHDWTDTHLSITLPPLPDIATGAMTHAHTNPSLSLSQQTQPTEVKSPPQLSSPDQSVGPAASPPLSTSSSSESRSLIHHRYQIRRVLGRGGFGRTYLAADTHRFDELCVLKQFIPASRSESSLRKARELFQREAKVLYQIDHPQIPKFLAWFTHEENLFIVQEYIDGMSYLDLLRDRQQQNRTFSEEEIIQWLRDLVPVLGYIHNIGIVHRDISPANVMFSNAKQKPMLIDFGVVKEVVNQILSGQYSTFAHPPKATLVGKPGYSPPEQIQLGDCFPCSDFYALGMTAIVLLTGQDARVSRAQWRQYSNVADPIANVIERMLAERPKERYQTAQSIMADLNRLNVQGFQAGSVPLPPPPPPLQSPMSDGAFSVPASSLNLGDASRSQSVPHLAQSNSYGWEKLQTPSLSAKFLAQCQQTLAEYIGPVASFAIEDVLTQSSELDRQQFLAQLAEEIPNSLDAQHFRERLKQNVQQKEISVPGQEAVTSQDDRSHSNQYSQRNYSQGNLNESVAHTTEYSASSPPTYPLKHEFIEQCRHELALCIGPMANFIVDDILQLSSAFTEDQFIEAIAAEIPNTKTADTFRQRFL